MKKVAGRLKIELSQFRDLEAFAQFGSDLDPDTQRTLARGERLVKTLNQGEREPAGRSRTRSRSSTRPPTASSTASTPTACREFHTGAGRAPARRRVGHAGEDQGRRLVRRDPGGAALVDRAVRRRLRLRPRRGGPAALPRTTMRAEEGRRRQRSSDEETDERARAAVGGGGRSQTPWPSRTSRAASRRSRTSRRSRARWRWSPPRACAGPSSASRRCGPTRARSGG